jgi:hypothetical protein
VKIVILIASPRRDGTVAQLASAYAEGAREAGHEVTLLFLADLSIRPCAACGRCIELGHCAVRDDIAKVEEALEGADKVVFATPTHYGNLSAPLLNCMERLVGFLVDKRVFPPKARTLRGKRAGALVACAAPWPFNRLLGHSSGCVSRLREVCKQAGLKFGGALAAPGTGRPGFSLVKYAERARRAGARA